jgi:hypothetical protein
MGYFFSSSLFIEIVKKNSILCSLVYAIFDNNKKATLYNRIVNSLYYIIDIFSHCSVYTIVL